MLVLLVLLLVPLALLVQLVVLCTTSTGTTTRTLVLTITGAATHEKLTLQHSRMTAICRPNIGYTFIFYLETTWKSIDEKQAVSISYKFPIFEETINSFSIFIAFVVWHFYQI